MPAPADWTRVPAAPEDETPSALGREIGPPGARGAMSHLEKTHEGIAARVHRGDPLIENLLTIVVNNPSLTTEQIVKELGGGYSTIWIKIILSSDAFKAQVYERTVERNKRLEEVAIAAAIDIKAHTTAAALTGLERMATLISRETSLKEVSSATSLLLDAMGVGPASARAAPPGSSINVHVNNAQSSAMPRDVFERARASFTVPQPESSNVLPAPESSPGGKSPTG